MLGFKEFVREQELEEGILRTGALIALSSKSKNEGDRAAQEFRVGISKLNTALSKDKSVDDRLRRLEGALGSTLLGMIHLRQQIGSAVGVSLSGHLLNAKLKTDKNRRR